LIEAYAQAGAAWLHLVDLDAARDGGYTLAPLLDQIKTRTALKLQSGGGVRSEADVRRLLDAGADRVVVGTLAVQAPERVVELLHAHGAERITVAMDVRQDEQGVWRAPAHGWTAGDAPALEALCSAFEGSPLRHVLSTDIGRDGMLSGPNLDLYAWWRQRAPLWQVQASGGVRDASDVGALRQSGVAGAILGRALLEGRLSVQEALAC
jgi:phosphoribosylformimino-5-aminoimidazole carboxamide ribotide isomerase